MKTSRVLNWDVIMSLSKIACLHRSCQGAAAALTLAGLLISVPPAFADITVMDPDPADLTQQLMTRPLPSNDVPAGLTPLNPRQERSAQARVVKIGLMRGRSVAGYMQFDVYNDASTAASNLIRDERDTTFPSRLGSSDVKMGGDAGKCEIYLSSDRLRHAAHCAIQFGITVVSGYSVQPASADPWAPGSASAVAKQLVEGAYNFLLAVSPKIQPRTSFTIEPSPPGTVHSPDEPWHVSTEYGLQILSTYRDWSFSVELQSSHDLPTLQFQAYREPNGQDEDKKTPITGTLIFDGQAFSAKGNYEIISFIGSVLQYSLEFNGPDGARLAERLRSPAQSITFVTQGKTLAVPAAGLGAAYMQLEKLYPTKFGKPLSWSSNSGGAPIRFGSPSK